MRNIPDVAVLAPMLREELSGFDYFKAFGSSTTGFHQEIAV